MKPYLTAAEAAALACVPEDVFVERAPKQGILPFAWMGTTLYRRVDIDQAMEAAWRQAADMVGRGVSSSARRANVLPGITANLPKPRPRWTRHG